MGHEENKVHDLSIRRSHMKASINAAGLVFTTILRPMLVHDFAGQTISFKKVMPKRMLRRRTANF
jgi:hypothetical protein